MRFRGGKLSNKKRVDLRARECLCAYDAIIFVKLLIDRYDRRSPILECFFCI